MSILRALKASQSSSKSTFSPADARSTQSVESSHRADEMHYSLDHPTHHELEHKHSIEEHHEDYHVHHETETHSKSSEMKKSTESASSQHQTIPVNRKTEDHVKPTSHENEDSKEITSDDEEEDQHGLKKTTMSPTQGIGMGLNPGVRIERNQQSEELSDLLSAAMASLKTFTSSSAEAESTPNDKDLLEEGPGMLAGMMTGSASGFKSEGALGAPSALGDSLPKPIAAAMRTARFTDFLNELSATVSQARLNSANGQDISLQLRSDVLEGTNVHIHANAAHMEVSFSTINAASNALLNTHLTNLQNHLTALCPGQIIDVKNQFLASGSSSEFNNEQESSQDDLASFNQRNRGNLSEPDDTL